MKITDIETPALIVDKNVLEQNMANMNKLLCGSALKLRPHYKSHKCSTLAKLQIENGAKGMTCATILEATDLCDNGVKDILIANQIVGENKINKLVELATKCYLTVCVDNEQNIDQIDSAAQKAGAIVNCYVEYDIGMERCGVIEQARVLELAKYILTKNNLTFGGIQAYAGHISHVENQDERKQMTAENSKKLKELIQLFEQNGIEVKNLSGGSTGTALIKSQENLYTELQAGSYMFMDATYAQLGLEFKNSLFIVATVVSVRDNLAVVDSGVKSCGIDQGLPVPCGFTAQKIVASEEHFQLHFPSKQLKVGEKILLTPAHCCSTVNLHDKIYLVEGQNVVDTIKVTARGWGR